MKGIASQQRKVARPDSSLAARVAMAQASAQVAAASTAAVAEADAGDLTTQIHTLKQRLDDANIP